MITMTIPALLALFTAISAAPCDAEDGKSTPDVTVSTAAPDNLGTVVEGLYRGARPEGDDQYAYLAKTLKVDTMVNLQHFHSDSEELCSRHGMDCRRFPIFLFFANDIRFDWKSFMKAFSFIVERKETGHRVYFHCAYGSDRTGSLAAALMIREAACGKSFDRKALWKQVDSEMEKHNFHGIYVFLRHSIKDWVFDFEKNQNWICTQNPDRTPSISD